MGPRIKSGETMRQTATNRPKRELCLLLRLTRITKERLVGRHAIYVCICNAIRESELRRAARRCPGGAESVYAALGKRPNCRQCLDEAEEIVFEERDLGKLPARAA